MPDYQAEKGIETFLRCFVGCITALVTLEASFGRNLCCFASFFLQTKRSDFWLNSMLMATEERSLNMVNNW